MIDKGFESLEFYQDSLKLLKATYRLANELPNYERYNLSDQMRRASCSILLNIAESYGRYHYLERLRFLYIARGSLSETLSSFIIAESLGYCTTEQLNWVRSLKEKIEREGRRGFPAMTNRVVEKNLNGYCRFIKSQQQGKNEYGNKYIKN